MFKNLAVAFSLLCLSTAACETSGSESGAANIVSESAASARQSAAPNSGEKSAENAANSDRKRFRGMINGTPFEMNLIREGNRLSGTYFYRKIGKDLKLDGTISADGNFNLTETDANGKATGLWKGVWKEDKDDNGIALEGSWKKPNEDDGKSLSFYATQQVIEFSDSVKIVDRTVNEKIKEKRSEISGVYPEITGINSAGAKKFNGLAKDFVTSANAAFKKNIAEMSAEDFTSLPAGMTLTNDVSYDVALANDNFISLIFADYTFMGGAHGGTNLTAVNYDLKKNRQLNLEDIFEPNSNYLKTISDYSIKQLKAKLTDMSDDEWINRGAAPEAENYAVWNLTKKGLMITFGQYQVAAYAAGMQTVIIPYDDLKGILKKDGTVTSLVK